MFMCMIVSMAGTPFHIVHKIYKLRLAALEESIKVMS